MSADTLVPHRRRLWLYALGGLIVLFLLLPALIVIPMSFSDSRFLQFPPDVWSLRWYRAYFSSLEWREATYVSFVVAVLTMLLATPLGTAAAYGLHVSRLRAARLIHIALTAPLIIPVILIGIGVFFLYARAGLNSTILGLVLAHSTLAIPFVLITVASGLQGYDLNQELVARSLGANRVVAFFTITLPQIRFPVMSGALLAFITSLDEVIVALFVAGGDRATLTKRMFTALRDEIDPTVAAISSLLILLSLVLLLMTQLLGRPSRRQRASGGVPLEPAR